MTASSFLKVVLGKSGAQALERAVGKQPALAGLLVPRAALAWLVDKSQFSGVVPGTSVPLLFKSESERYTGAVGLPEGEYHFDQVSPEHLAAVVALALDVDLPGRSASAGLNLAGLGRSIDNLAKAQRSKERAKMACSVCGSEFAGKSGDGKVYCRAHAGTKKTELPGQTAAPRAQQEAVAPQQPKKQPKLPKPKLPRPASLKLGKSEAASPCPACGGSQFDQNRFRGCLCYRDLASQTKTSVYSDGYVLEFRPGVDREAVLALRLAFKGSE